MEKQKGILYFKEWSDVLAISWETAKTHIIGKVLELDSRRGLLYKDIIAVETEFTRKSKSQS